MCIHPRKLLISEFISQSDWPLEIVFDRQALVNYNAVFRFLMRIKRVNYLIQKRDFWVTMRVPRASDSLNVQEQLIVKNKIEFNRLMFKVQLFQREMHHFTENFESYIKQSALQGCCRELSAKLEGLTGDAEQTSLDMDALIKLFKHFQNQVLRRCWLDHYMWVVKKEVSGLMETVLDFRKLCKKFLYSTVERDEDSDEELLDDENQILVGANRHYKEGLLKVTSRDYMETQTLF